MRIGAAEIPVNLIMDVLIHRSHRGTAIHAVLDVAVLADSCRPRIERPSAAASGIRLLRT